MDLRGLRPGEQAILQRFFLLQGVRQTVVASTLADPRREIRTFERGEVLFDPTHFHGALGLILSGRVEVSQRQGERDLILSIHRPGDVFGAAAMFPGGSAYVSQLVALEPAKVVFFSQALLEELMEADFTAAKNYIAFLSGRIQFLNGRIQSLLAGNAEQLLAKFLASHGGDVLELDISLSKLALRLGTSRASLYRAFDALTEKKLIERAGKRIAILDRDTLLQL